MLGLGLGLNRARKRLRPRNLLVYNPTTWAEWTGKEGTIGDSTGLEFTSDGTSIDPKINTALKDNTKYGILYNTVSSTVTTGAWMFGGNSAASAFVDTSLTKTVGNKKLILTTRNPITTNKVQLYLYSDVAIGQKIKIKDIRIFELPPNTIIEADFTNKTADELNTKYPY
jgi:hypothetical protein